MSAFEELGICPEIIRAVEEDDWLLPTPVQQEAVPLILTGGDVLAAAETGSGKTGAFGLPCLQIVHETLRGKCEITDPNAANVRCELSATDKDMHVQVLKDGLECRSEKNDRWYGVRGTIAVGKGRYMFEVEVVSGLTRVGWSAPSSRLELGTEFKSFGYGSTGKKSSNKQYEDYGEPFDDGDVIGCLLDREQRTVSFCKNGKDLGVAFTIDAELEETGLCPHVCGKGFKAVANFDGPMAYPVEAYSPLGDVSPEHAGLNQAGEKRFPLCLILEPSRELADQTYKCMTKFSKYLEPSVKSTLLVGGVDDKEQINSLERGVDVVVGTLQKTADLVRKGNLNLDKVRFFVLDEADDLQKKDDKGDITALNEQIKRSRKDRVQTLLFSATLHSPEIHKLIDEITVNATWVDLKGKDAVPDTVHHFLYQVDPKLDLEWSDEAIAVNASNPDAQPTPDGVHKGPSMSPFDSERPEALRNSERIKQLKPKILVKIVDSFKMTQCIIFCRTNIDCNNLESYFKRLGGDRHGYGGKMESGKENPYSCVVLGGGRNQAERKRNLEAFKEGDVRFLIATDVAARGIDISGLPYVIQMQIPDDIENYVHRIGRCGRAERMGLAIAIVATEREKVWYVKKGRDPKNTKLTVPFGSDGKPLPEDKERWFVEEGGCTIWYDEPELLGKLTERIGQSIQVMDRDDFSVDDILESPLEEKFRKKKGADDPDKEPPSRRQLKRKPQDSTKKAIVYGSRRNDAVASVVAGTATAIAPTVGELHTLETKIQQIFARSSWNGIHNAPAGAEAMSDGAKPVLASVAQVVAPSAAAAPASASGQPAKKKVRW